MNFRLIRLLTVAVTALALGSGAALAADPYPSKPIQLVVAASAGGNADVVARLIAQKLGEVLGQPIVVENRAGGVALVATRSVATSPPDGYTILIVANTFSIAPTVFSKPGYDPVRDFTGIGLISRTPLVVVAPANSPFASATDLIAAARQRPGQLPYASGGNGSSTHMSAAMFTQQTNVQMIHVPYRGNAPAMPDVMSGRVTILFDTLNTSVPLIRAGRLKPLGQTGSQRSPLLPQVPTLMEQGVPGYEFFLYNGLVAPAKTPPEIIAKLHGALSKAMASPELRERFSRDGAELIASESPAKFSEFLQQEVERYLKLGSEIGITKE